VERFAGRPFQFVLVTGEKDSTLLPFLEEHPIGGWVLQDPRGATGSAYGLERPEPVIIGADRLILGFDHGFESREEVVSAVLADRMTLVPPKPTPEDLAALFQTSHPRGEDTRGE